MFIEKKEFFIQFIDTKYHKFVLYAHNFSSFDGILILESLVYMCENHNLKIEPLIRDNKIISIKIRFGKTSQNRYRYYIDFHDSLLLLLSSLEKLSITFLKDHPEIQKISNKNALYYLLFEKQRLSISSLRFISELELYCERDSLCLAYVINIFSQIIYERYKINIHKYPTISSLSLAIYLTHYLESDDLIPLISGEIYRDISKAYHGGHTDVYQLYSNEPVHSYDFVSMYPTQMLKHEMPVGEINKFIGNPLLTGETLESLSEQLAFIKCSIYVDKSLNRPVYQTIVNINGELRSVCATGTFLNQWIFVPELLKYQELTNGLIKIIPDSIQMGYLFEKKIIFKDYIEHLFTLRKSVPKDHPLNQICKINMNSLYGRMGLRQELTEYKFKDKLEIEKFSFNEIGREGGIKIL
jgi:DNA polymerase type B, organellar and viral